MRAPVETPNPPVEEDDEGAPPRLQFTARNVLVLGGVHAPTRAAQ